MLKAAYRWLRTRALGAVCRVSPELLARLRFRAAWGRWPDFENPTNFDEKLLWLNLYWQHPVKTECGDKYTLRQHLEKQGLGHVLPRLYGAYLSPEEIDLAALPERFVLKCSHGAKCCVFCRDKQKLDMDSYAPHPGRVAGHRLLDVAGRVALRWDDPANRLRGVSRRWKRRRAANRLQALLFRRPRALHDGVQRAPSERQGQIRLLRPGMAAASALLAERVPRTVDSEAGGL